MGNALHGGEYAIIDTLEADSADMVERWNDHGADRERALAFVKTHCPSVLRGIFRASDHSPPCLFYAHREHVHMAAHVAMADSILRTERGFPMLLDVADAACRGVFGSDSFLGMVPAMPLRVTSGRTAPKTARGPSTRAGPTTPPGFEHASPSDCRSGSTQQGSSLAREVPERCPRPAAGEDEG